MLYARGNTGQVSFASILFADCLLTLLVVSAKAHYCPERLLQTACVRVRSRISRLYMSVNQTIDLRATPSPAGGGLGWGNALAMLMLLWRYNGCRDCQRLGCHPVYITRPPPPQPSPDGRGGEMQSLFELGGWFCFSRLCTATISANLQKIVPDSSAPSRG